MNGCYLCGMYICQQYSSIGQVKPFNYVDQEGGVYSKWPYCTLHPYAVLDGHWGCTVYILSSNSLTKAGNSLLTHV